MTGREKLGYHGDKAHDALIQEMERAETFLRDALSSSFSQIQRNWQFYLGDRDDVRLPHEKEWRANIHRPRPFSTVEVQTATVTDVLGSVPRPIQPDPVGLEDEEAATPIERILHYFTRRLKWEMRLDMAARNSTIQGLEVRKAIWLNNTIPYYHVPTEEDIQRFDQAILEAEQLGAGEAPRDDPEALLLWRDLVNEAKNYGTIPEPPFKEYREMVHYRGPGWEHIPVFDMRFDPKTTYFEKQGIIMQRAVRPAKMLLQMADDDPTSNLPYDIKALTDAIGASTDAPRFSEWESQIARMLGLEATNLDSQEDPFYKQKVELFEIWRKGEDFPFLVMANRHSFINKFPDQWPFWHRQYPYHSLRNIALDGYAVGLTELKQNIPLYEEVDELSNLRLDAVNLAIMPILMRLKEAGLPEMLQRLVPGMILDVATLEGVKALNDNIHIPEAIFREISENIAETDETSGTQDIVRGASAPFSRTTASEIQNRLGRALVRQTRKVARWEAELSTVVPQWLMLCFQFAPKEWRVRVGGNDAIDPFMKYSRNDFREAIEMDYAFRGATNAINKELRTQQLGDMLARAVQGGVNLPSEIRSWLKRTYESLGYKGSNLLFTREGDAYASLLDQGAMINAQIAIAMAQQGGAPPGSPPPEGQ